MQLYGRRSSINVQKVLWCMEELGLKEAADYTRIDAGLHFGVVNTPEFLKLNPNGLVPTLVDGDLVLWESNTIARYLVDTHRPSHLLPANVRDRYDVERWMDWQLVTLWPTLRGAFLGLTRTPEAERNMDAIKKSYADASALLKIVETQLNQHAFVTATGFTLADIVIALSVDRWIGLSEQFPDVTGQRPPLPALEVWFKTLSKRASFQATIAK